MADLSALYGGMLTAVRRSWLWLTGIAVYSVLALVHPMLIYGVYVMLIVVVVLYVKFVTVLLGQDRLADGAVGSLLLALFVIYIVSSVFLLAMIVLLFFVVGQIFGYSGPTLPLMLIGGGPVILLSWLLALAFVGSMLPAAISGQSLRVRTTLQFAGASGLRFLFEVLVYGSPLIALVRLVNPLGVSIVLGEHYLAGATGLVITGASALMALVFLAYVAAAQTRAFRRGLARLRS